MKEEYVQSFILKNGENFDPAFIPDIKSKLEAMDDNRASIVMSLSFQNPTVILIIAIFLGWDRFFLNDIALGILKVVTCYGVGIWWLIDIFTAQQRTREYNYRKFVQYCIY